MVKIILLEGSWFTGGQLLNQKRLTTAQLRALSPTQIAEWSNKVIAEDAKTVISAKPQLSIGRDESSDIVIDSSYVSRTHGLLFLDKGRWKYKDNSSYGTILVRTKQFAQGKFGEDKMRLQLEKTDDPVFIEDGDILEFGGKVLVRGSVRIGLTETGPDSMEQY